MLGQIIDLFRQQSDLDRRRPCVFGMHLEIVDHLNLFFLNDGQWFFLLNLKLLLVVKPESRCQHYPLPTGNPAYLYLFQ